MDDQTVFAEEIDYRELRLDQIVGRGAFGVVQHGKWRGIHVAVKHIETESEKKAFITELKQLSRVSHRNIVTLYGACTQTPVCLVMEYAEGGSLYNVLHGVDSQPDYTLGHAMSWCYQCSLGVEYLHGMKPRPLIHRDLKPPNLLLVAGGTILKICDFGTACDAQTHMTNNKGSAAWMAPEVFEGSKYSEKCDVFSFGIILWEVLSRRKPFDEIGGPAFRIMWAVHNGTRPPLISNCPKSVQKLMTRCWSANPIERPSMGEVVRIMGMLMPYCVGGDVPLVYPEQLDSDLISSSCVGSTPPYTNPTPGSGGSSTIHDLRDTVRQALYGKGGAGQPVPVQPQTPKVKPVVVEDETTNWRRTSAPASLAASRENLLDKSSRSSTPNVDLFKRYSADLTRLEEVDILAQGAAMGASNKPPKRTHRRTGSHGTPFVFTSTTNANLLSPTWAPPKARGHKRTGSFGNSPFAKSASDLTDAASSLPHAHTVPTSLGGVTSAAGPHVTWSNMSAGVTSAAEVSKVTQEEMLNNMMNIPMDYQLQPLPPCKSNKESMDIYNEHRKLAEEFYRVQVEIMVLQKRNDELEKQLAEDEQEQLSNNQLVEEYQQLVSENENLLLLQKNVMKSIDQWKREQRQQNTLKRTTPPTALTSSDV